MTGVAVSYDFPTTTGAYLTNKTTQYAAFVAKLNLGASSTGSLTTLTSSNNPQSVGTNVTFTSFVESTSGSGIPTGTVTFSVDGRSGTAVTLDSTGHASYTLDTLTDGPHIISASYSGDKTYSSSGNKLTEIIAGAPASIMLVSGGGQTGTQNALLPSPVVVIVKDTSGNPVPNVNISFGGSGLSYLAIGSSGYATTGYNGQVSVGVIPYTTGSLTGNAKAPGVNTPAFFSVTSNSRSATPLPTFSPAAGTYSATQTVKIIDSDPTAAIYYTINGGAPSTSSTQYTHEITVSSSETIKAIAFANGKPAEWLLVSTRSHPPAFNLSLSRPAGSPILATRLAPLVARR